MQGSIFEREKKFELAEEAFRKVITSDPKNAGALNYLGYMLADRGTRLEEALAMLRKAVQLDPQNGAYLDSLGWAYFKMGSYEQAEENLRKASEKIGSDPTVQDHLGDLYLKTGRLKAGGNPVGAGAGSVGPFGSSGSGSGRCREGAEKAGVGEDQAGPADKHPRASRNFASTFTQGTATAAPFACVGKPQRRLINSRHACRLRGESRELARAADS